MTAAAAPVPASAARVASVPRLAYWEWGLLACALAITVAARLPWAAFDLDDSFITYTYARSLGEGQGFTFAGQKALGTTTPLYALILALFNSAGLPIPAAAKGVGVLAALASTGLLFLLVRGSLGPAAGCAAALLLSINARHAAITMSGMETALYVAVCLGALLALHHDRSRWTAALGAVACLLRPDGLLLALVLAGALWIRRGRVPRPALLMFGLPVVGWVAYAWVEFGSPIPASVTAKLAYPEYGPFRLDAAAATLGTDLQWGVALLAAFGVWACLQRRSLLPLVTWTLVYLLAFTRAPNFPWYYVPAIPGLIALCLAGLRHLLDHAAGRSEDGRRLAIAASLVLAVMAGWVTMVDEREHRERMERVYGPGVTSAYRDLALWFRDNTPEGAWVAAPEVGYVGFYSRRKVLDLAGLCSPEVIPYLPDRRYVDIVQDFSPDFVALTTEPNRPIHNTISESSWFRAHYTACKKFPYRGGQWYVVYRRVPHPSTGLGMQPPPPAADSHAG